MAHCASRADPGLDRPASSSKSATRRGADLVGHAGLGKNQVRGNRRHFQGDAQNFVNRCKEVERALYRIGIPRRSWLIQPTPSGGRHYYAFFYRSVVTWEISQVLELVNLRHINGQHEIYPSETHGLRLPFGWIPGTAHEPEAWVEFIRAYDDNTFPA